MKIIIKDEIGPRCIIKEDGQKIYERIHTPLKEVVEGHCRKGPAPFAAN
ncbi:MAG: hypothetical protein JRJ42_11600 [Deltaproteobacteria bacterium]|nr:hypothetical protein [Deltaproteobacteria bacterium]